MPARYRAAAAQRVSEQQIIAHLVAQMIAAVNADAQPRGAHLVIELGTLDVANDRAE
jgi:hypothetical protein